MVAPEGISPGMEAFEKLFTGPLTVLTAPNDDDSFPVVSCWLN